MAVSREQLIFDAFANTSRAEAGFQALGRKAGAASDDVAALAKRLDGISAKSATARVKLEGNTEALAQLDRLDLKMAVTGNKVMRPDITVEGAARAAVEISAVDAALDKIGKGGGGGGSAGAATAGLQGLATPMTGLIAGGVALAPLVATLAVGLTGVAAAAYGVAKPIENAAKKTGGLQANLALLNPEQQQVARSLLALGKQYGAFEKALQPQILGDFNQGIKLAGTLMHDVEPVAKGTASAIGSLVAGLDAEFKSATWTQFFSFMATTGVQDVRMLDTSLLNLVHTLPVIIQNIQPLTQTMLDMTVVISRLAALSADAGGGLQKTGAGAHQAAGPLGTVGSTINRLLLDLTPFSPDLRKVWDNLAGVAGSSSATSKGLRGTGHGAAAAASPVWNLNTAVTALNTSMTTLVGNLLTLQGGNLSWQQAVQGATSQLKSNNAGLEGNSKNALANRQAVLNTTNAAIGFAQQQLTLGKNIGGASQTVQAQIKWLQGLHDKSKFVQDEIAALRREEARLQAQRVNQTIHVQGLGQWSVSQSLAPGAHHRRATGGRVPGYGGGDRWPALLEGGEAIVPKHLTPMVAPFLKAHKVPGFAAGGLIPSYSGSAAMAPWVKTDDAATIRLIDQAVVKATVAGMRAAAAAARAAAAASGFGHAGPGGGAPAANAALARRMFPGENFAAWNYVAMRESGWNQFARNPSSGAYGIAQALPPTKYPFAGQAAGGSNPAAQISWMEGYMRSRYGGAAGAAAHERAFNWYGSGGSEIFTHPTVIGVGERGPERVDVIPVGSRGTRSGPLVHIDNFISNDATDPLLLSQRISYAVTAASLGS